MGIATYFKKSQKLIIMIFLIMLCFNEFVFSQIDTNAIHVDTAIIDTSIVSLKENSDYSKKILY